MLTAAALKALLREQRLRLSRRLGQHHLIDARAIERVAQACRLSSQETVIEIGAGLGALTELLAQRAGCVIAVEVDERFARLLAGRLSDSASVAVVCQDILTISWERVRGAMVVGAIPYHITSPILVSLSEAGAVIRRAILILQEEVAGRLLARPGTKAYGRLSVLAQYSWEIEPLFTVPRSAFFPQPTVDSRCIRLTPRLQAPVELADVAFFFRVVKAAFSQRRKTVVNCLAGSDWLEVPRARLEALVRGLGLSASIRGEALSLEQLAGLANALARRAG